MTPEQLDARGGQGAARDRSRLVERDAGLVAAGGVRHRAARLEVGGLVEAVVVGPQPQPHRAGRPGAPHRGGDQVELAGAVERDPRARRNGAADELRRPSPSR